MKSNTDLWYLQNVNLYKLLCPITSERRAEQKGRHEYKKGEFIYFPNDASDKIYFIDQGRVKIGTYSKDGKEIIKAILQRGEIFGELSLVGEETRNNFAMAMDHGVKLCERTLDDTKKLMMVDQDFSLHITRMIGNKLIKTERRLESLVFKDAKARIIEFLNDLGGNSGTKVGLETLVQNFYTHQEIANLTGTSRQTVTTTLNELRDKNLIYFDRRRLLIRDLDTFMDTAKKVALA